MKPSSPLLTQVKALCQRFWDPAFIFNNILFPLVVLAIYLATFAFLLSDVFSLSSSVNYVFLTRSLKYALVLLAAVALSYGVSFNLDQIKAQLRRANRPGIRLSRIDFLLVLLPLTPVVQYAINNRSILAPVELWYAIGFFFLISVIFIIVLPFLLSYLASGRVLMILGMTFVYTLTSMAALSHQMHWHQYGSIKVQVAFFLGVFAVAWLLTTLKDKQVLPLLVVVIFIANTGSQVMMSSTARAANQEIIAASAHRLVSLTQGRSPKVTPNIYLLVYDSYVPNETMLGYGIDNSAQEEFLRENGFVLYPHTYSVGANTADTMSRVLNASTSFYGDSKRAAAGYGIAQNLLKSFGYKTYGIFESDYFFQMHDPFYDVYFPQHNSSPTNLLKAILIGEFQFELGFTQVSREAYHDMKRSVFEKTARQVVFLYTHSYFPGHSQNSGACLPDETEQYAARLSSANIEMQQDTETILKNDPNAIIIVAGDHGPNLTRNCYWTSEAYSISEISRLDIQDRYGTFLAIRWPNGDNAVYDNITVLQDLFPAVFAYLYQDAQFLEAKIDPTTVDTYVVSGAYVEDGWIFGGLNAGEPLFSAER